MATFTKYTNEFGTEITFAQIEQTDIYIKQIYNNDVLEKEEFYGQNQLVNITYHIANISQIDAILNQNPDASFKYSYQESIYTIFEHLDYNDSILKGKIAYVRNQNNYTICYQAYNLPDGTPNYKSTEKSYYEDNKLKYTFVYLATGDCLMIYNEQEDQADISPFTIGEPDQTFTWDDFEYYEFANPLIP